MKNERKKLIIRVIIITIVCIGIIFFNIDKYRVAKEQNPIFCIKKGVYKDGGTVVYLGLGYKVIDFHTLDGFDDIKIGSWFMDFGDFAAEERLCRIEREHENEIKNLQTFYAKIETIIRIYEKPSILVKGLEVNDMNYRGEFVVFVDDDTDMSWRGRGLVFSDLEEGDNISIMFDKDKVRNKFRPEIEETVKIQLLDDEL